MLREHIPLIAVTAVVALLFYLVFRDLRGLRAGLDTLAAQQLMAPPELDDAAKLQLQQQQQMAELQHLQLQAQAQAAAAAQAQAQAQPSAPPATETPGATAKPAGKRA